MVLDELEQNHKGSTTQTVLGIFLQNVWTMMLRAILDEERTKTIGTAYGYANKRNVVKTAGAHCTA